MDGVFGWSGLDVTLCSAALEQQRVLLVQDKK